MLVLDIRIVLRLPPPMTKGFELVFSMLLRHLQDACAAYVRRVEVDRTIGHLERRLTRRDARADPGREPMDG